jgi:hypothetical protein
MATWLNYRVGMVSTEWQAFQFFAAMQKVQLDEKGDFQDLRADFFKQCGGGGGGSASGEEIINQDNAAAGFNGVNVNGDGVRAVFEIVILFVNLERQLAFFANGHKTGFEAQRGGGGKDEAAGINADDGIHGAGFVIADEEINAAGEKLGIGQDRRDVLELNAGLRKIRDVADGAFDVGGGGMGMVHEGNRN